MRLTALPPPPPTPTTFIRAFCDGVLFELEDHGEENSGSGTFLLARTAQRSHAVDARAGELGARNEKADGESYMSDDARLCETDRTTVVFCCRNVSVQSETMPRPDLEEILAATSSPAAQCVSPCPASAMVLRFSLQAPAAPERQPVGAVQRQPHHGAIPRRLHRVAQTTHARRGRAHPRAGAEDVARQLRDARRWPTRRPVSTIPAPAARRTRPSRSAR